MGRNRKGAGVVTRRRRKEMKPLGGFVVGMIAQVFGESKLGIGYWVLGIGAGIVED
jgi:hypothetical protein